MRPAEFSKPVENAFIRRVYRVIRDPNAGDFADAAIREAHTVTPHPINPHRRQKDTVAQLRFTKATKTERNLPSRPLFDTLLRMEKFSMKRKYLKLSRHEYF